jgi:hypothetical protein
MTFFAAYVPFLWTERTTWTLICHGKETSGKLMGESQISIRMFIRSATIWLLPLKQNKLTEGNAARVSLMATFV